MFRSCKLDEIVKKMIWQTVSCVGLRGVKSFFLAFRYAISGWQVSGDVETWSNVTQVIPIPGIVAFSFLRCYLPDVTLSLLFGWRPYMKSFTNTVRVNLSSKICIFPYTGFQPLTSSLPTLDLPSAILTLAKPVRPYLCWWMTTTQKVIHPKWDEEKLRLQEKKPIKTVIRMDKQMGWAQTSNWEGRMSHLSQISKLDMWRAKTSH